MFKQFLLSTARLENHQLTNRYWRTSRDRDALSVDQDIVKTCLSLMPRLLIAFVIVFALLAMVQGQQHQFIPLPTGPMPAVLIP